MLTEINLVISGLSGASNIAKGIIRAESAIDKAELQLKIAELMQTLAETSSSVSQIKSDLINKDEYIRSLEEKLKIKEELVRENGAYYKKDESGNAIGEAFCSKCWDVEKLLVHIVRPTATIDLECPNCKQEYDGNSVYLVKKS